MHEVTTRDEIDTASGQDWAVLFKHSTSCPISAMAHQAMSGWVDANPDAPVYLVDVNEASDASRYVTEQTGVEHQSPQVILLRGGSPTWHASRFEITAESLRDRLGPDTGDRSGTS